MFNIVVLVEDSRIGVVDVENYNPSCFTHIRKIVLISS